MTQIWRNIHNRNVSAFFLALISTSTRSWLRLRLRLRLQLRFDLPLGAHLSCGSWTIKCRGTGASSAMHKQSNEQVSEGKGGIWVAFCCAYFLGFLLFFGVVFLCPTAHTKFCYSYDFVLLLLLLPLLLSLLLLLTNWKLICTSKARFECQVCPWFFFTFTFYSISFAITCSTSCRTPRTRLPFPPLVDFTWSWLSTKMDSLEYFGVETFKKHTLKSRNSNII